MTLQYFFLAVVLGAAVSVYIPMISKTSQLMGSPLLANIPFFGMALAFSVIIAAISGFRLSDLSKMGAVPAWLFLAGAVSALAIIGASFLVPRIGAGVLFVLLVAGQILFGAVVSQFGLLGAPKNPVTLVQCLGIAFVIFGAAIVSFSGDPQ